MANFHLDLYDKKNVRKAVLVEAQGVSYEMRVNYPGSLTFTLDGKHEMVSQIEVGWRCDVWRQLPNAAWTKEFIAYIEDVDWRFTDRPLVTYSGRGALSLLDKRIVAWYANTASRSAFYSQKSEAIAIGLMYYNIGAGAKTANGRHAEGTDSRIMVPASQGRGVSLDWFCAWENLLETMQKLAEVGGFDFDLVPVSDSYLFTYYPDQLGTDRTASQVFSLERGNMANPRHVISTKKAPNIIIVGGKGEEIERELVTVQGEGYTLETHSETFLDATDVETTSAMISRGLGKLKEIGAQNRFTFDILQALYSNFGVDYFLGDLVKVISPRDRTTYTMKIDSATIEFSSDGRETISVGVK